MTLLTDLIGLNNIHLQLESNKLMNFKNSVHKDQTEGSFVMYAIKIVIPLNYFAEIILCGLCVFVGKINLTKTLRPQRKNGSHFYIEGP